MDCSTTSWKLPPRKARAAFGRAEKTVAALEGEADAALSCLSDGWEDATAVLALPPKYRHRLRTTKLRTTKRDPNASSRKRSGGAKNPFAPSRTRSRRGDSSERSARRNTTARRNTRSGLAGRRYLSGGGPSSTSGKHHTRRRPLPNPNRYRWQPEHPLPPY